MGFFTLAPFSAQAQQAVPPSTCDVPHLTVLQTAAASFDARGIWLTQHVLV